jgi:1-acyl-sn-glycerol-3-phosphate acyltransferase
MSYFNSIEYDDIVYRHRQSSDLLWSLKTWHHPLFDNKEQSIKSKQLINKNTQISSIITPVHYKNLPRTSEQIKTDVLNSLALKYTIETLDNEINSYAQAKNILHQMSHRLNMRSVRFLAFIFAKILNQVYENIYIDQKGIDILYQLYSLTPLNPSPTIPSSSSSSSPITISSTLFAILNTFSRSSSSSSINSEKILLSSPLTTKYYITSPRIIYLPTHRSYMDFIILTYLCFEYNIPLPCIAAAQDFLGLGLLANLLRNAGAFFIRRSFRTDLLYWTIFDEYVKTHLIHGDYPLEFFIEGARSRTLKTLLPPRQGMLKSCIECYFRRQIDNLILIPISINYEKVLEDNLHANELLGIPKPKESKSGLLKATQILKKSFGSMIIKFSQPIYIHDAYEIFKKQEENKLNNKDIFNRSIPRGIQPNFICQQDGFNELEQNFLDELSYRVIHEQQCLTVIYPITIAAFSFLNSSIVTTKNRSISIEQLFIDKNILFIDNTGVLEYFSSHYQISWPSNNDKNHLKQRLLSLYSDIFELFGYNQLTLKMSGDRLIDASLLMKLIMYRNTCLHLFAKPAYILLACQMNSQVTKKPISS